MENTIYKVDHRYNPTRPSTDPSTPFSYRAQIEQLLMQRTTSHQTKKPIEMKKDSFDLIMEEDLARQVELLEMQEAEQPSKHICNPAVATAPASQPSTPESRQDTVSIDSFGGNEPLTISCTVLEATWSRTWFSLSEIL